MSDTRTRLTEDMKTYMKSGDKKRLGIVRMLLTEVKNAEINDLQEKGRPRNEEETMTLISAYHKSLAKTLAEYPPERQAELKEELAIVEEYLPKRLGVSELRDAIKTELKSNPERNFGLLMKHFQTRFGAQTEGKTLSETLRDVLKEV